MNFKHLLSNADFLQSAAKPQDLPDDTGYEVAFAGRSNAGKSSVLNKICNRKNLAKASKTPGRTQMINFFALSNTARLVDLPGYGYAKASQAKQRQWTQLLEHYFDQRQALTGVILVMDIRHPLKVVDQTMLEWCAYQNQSIHILLNKADKLSRNQNHVQLMQVNKHLRQFSGESASCQLFSAMSGLGSEELLEKLESWLGFKK